MDAVTYGNSRVHRVVPEATKGKTRTSLFARFVEALRESRRQQARRVIENHAHLPSSAIPDGIER
jgi:hypothetical protein